MTAQYDVAGQLKKLRLQDLIGPMDRAGRALTRVDERLKHAPDLADGFRARAHFLETCAAMWLDGELVHLEDLVLHDAGADVRTPTHELTLAARLMRLRRRIEREPADWALTGRGVTALAGRGGSEIDTDRNKTDESGRQPVDDEAVVGDALLAEIDAVAERARRLAETPDFHIMYGPNEAGKTTTMEAALRLFYGFPLREGYAFKHQRSNLQVSGQLEIDGQLRRFTRLPKRSGSLVDEAGTALPETALSAHLAGLSKEDYRKLLCLDDETIERGGEEIAQAHGDIGRLLFSAAAGVADLSTVLADVREEADAIWRKRASKTRVAELKRDLTHVEKDIRERDVSASAWRGLKTALAEARAAESEARAVRDALHERAAQIAAKRRAVPLLVEIDGLAELIAPFAAYPDRLDFDPERLVGLLAEDSQATADLQRLEGEIEEMTLTRDSTNRAPELVVLSDNLDALEGLRARDVTAGLDLAR